MSTPEEEEVTRKIRAPSTFTLPKGMNADLTDLIREVLMRGLSFTHGYNPATDFRMHHILSLDCSLS